MATIPRLVGPQVRATPEPSRLAPVSTYAGVDPTAPRAIAQGLASVADALQRERERLDTIRVNEAEVELTARVDEALSGQEKGILNQRGGRAIEGLDPFRESLRRSISDVESRLSTDRQREVFRQRATQFAAAADKRATAYALGESRRLDAETHTALLQRDERALAEVAKAGDDAAASATIAQMVERTRAFGERNGHAPEAIAEAVTNLQSAGRATQVLALVNAGTDESLQQASDLFAKYRTEMTPETRAKVQEPLQEARERRAVVTAAERILAAKDADPEVSTEALLRDVPLEVRADVRRFVNGELDARTKERRERVGTMLLEDANRVEAGRGTPARSLVDPTRWREYTIEQRQALERLADAQRGDGEGKQSDRVWLDFYLMAPSDLAKMPRDEFVTRYWSKFDRSHRTRAEEMWKAAQGGPATGAGRGLYSPAQRTERVYQTMFQEGPDKKDWDAEQFAAFEDAADLAVRQASETKGGKPLTDAELNDVLVRTATQMRTAPTPEGTGWGAAFGAMAQRSAWSLADQYGVPREPEAAAVKVVPYAAIPPMARDTIAKQMREQGRGASQARIETAFAALVRGDTVTYNAEVGTPINPEAMRALIAPGWPQTGFSKPSRAMPGRNP